MASSSSALRRLPLREAISALTSPGASGSTPLGPRVRKLTLRYLPKNSSSGAREFLKSIAPRIAYHNPSLPISVERIPDARGKSKNPKDRDAGVEWTEGRPRHEMVIELNDAPATSIDITDLSSSDIWESLLSTIRAGQSSVGAADSDPSTLPASSEAPPPTPTAATS